MLVRFRRWDGDELLFASTQSRSRFLRSRPPNGAVTAMTRGMCRNSFGCRNAQAPEPHLPTFLHSRSLGFLITRSPNSITMVPSPPYHCIAMHCIALHCIASYCIALHCIATHCICMCICICICICIRICLALHCSVVLCSVV